MSVAEMSVADAMLASMSAPSPPRSATGFDTGWCASDLGDHRPCRYTYEVYPYESLPPLGPFSGAFEWFGDLGDPVPDRVARLDRLAVGLAAQGLALPGDFVAFHTGGHSDLALDEVSVTACWTDVSEPLPSPVEPGAFLVRFLRDQQDCVLWYLYLRPSGETFVVYSGFDYEYEFQARADGEETGADLGDRAAITWCAPSFEEFAGRFWIENRAWHALHGGDVSPLDPLVSGYLSHYAR
jgi:hypothetical protein